MKTLCLTSTVLIAFSFAGLTSCVSMSKECTTCCSVKPKAGAACCDTKKPSKTSKTGAAPAGDAHQH